MYGPWLPGFVTGDMPDHKEAVDVTNCYVEIPGSITTTVTHFNKSEMLRQHFYFTMNLCDIWYGSVLKII